MHSRFVIAFVVALFVQATLGTAFGALTVTGQSRTLLINGVVGGPLVTEINNSLTAPVDAPFDQTLTGTAAIGTLIASQTSSFGAMGNSFVVSAVGHGSATITDSGASYQANSVFDLTFTVDVPTPYQVTGSVGFAGTTDTSQIFLKQGTNYIFHTEIQDGVTIIGANPLSQSGILQPGSYELSGSVLDGFAGTVTNETGDFTLNFTATTSSVPLPSALKTGLAMLVAINFAAMIRRSFRTRKMVASAN
jgi:hypothetical protein